MRLDRVPRWLARISPLIYRTLRRPWRVVRPYLPVDDAYWIERQQFNYYSEVVRLARQYVPEGGSVIDVGAGVTHLLERLDWFERRVALDRHASRRQRGVEHVHADFLAYEPDRRFDLVLNLQVLEHLDQPAVFARKLFDTGRVVIISVPYRWPAGFYPPHVQDPVDEGTLAAWTSRTPTETLVVRDGGERLVAVYAPAAEDEPEQVTSVISAEGRR